MNSQEYSSFYHLHIRKCGGTHINKYLLHCLGGNDKTYDDLTQHPNILEINQRKITAWNPQNILSNEFFYAWSHIPFWNLQFNDRTLVFTVFRDPA